DDAPGAHAILTAIGARTFPGVTPDLIIVGGGTAGCVLAERLTRGGRLRVLVVEAGGEPESPFVRIPAGFAQLFRSRYDWAFESEPTGAVGGRRVFTPRG